MRLGRMRTRTTTLVKRARYPQKLKYKIPVRRALVIG